MDKSANLILDSDTMCFFIDESGVSSLPSTHEAFCLGGCLVHSSQIPDLERQWKSLMLRLFNSPTHVFHASDDVSKNLSKENRQKIYNFFKKNFFGRFAVGYHRNSSIDSYPADPYRICSSLLVEKGFIKLLENYPILKPFPASVQHPDKNILLHFNALPFRRIEVIMEDCERDRALIERSYGNVEHYTLNGINITPEFYFMPKRSAHTCLQIADIISNASLREVKRHHKEAGKEQAYDFKEIFHTVDDRVNYFFLLRGYLLIAIIWNHLDMSNSLIMKTTIRS